MDAEHQIDLYMTTDVIQRAAELLGELYDEKTASETAQRIWARLPERKAASAHKRNDCMLITYADSVQEHGQVPLQTLHTFLQQYLGEECGRVHILPFYPSSSDDGFAVIDYRMVDHHVGAWSDVERLACDFDLMFDLVINHCSRENLWFADFVGDREPGRRYFITLPEESDTSAVARPRSTPLISAVHTYNGIRHVWNTFSDDQIDLDFTNPDVLIEMVDVLLFYIARGASLIRLDAVGYLWKRLGTSCLNLPEAHAAVKLLRLVSEAVDPEVRLITETNVPHEENIAYFGCGDEAHLVYQFSLAPLLLHAFTFEDASYLTRWAADLEPPPAGAAYLNFIASHDGIGMRPLEGLVPDSEVERLVQRMHELGGFVTLRDVGEGQQKPYEINISLMSAFGGSRGLDAYLAAHALCLSFQGSPAIYIHSFLGTQNDLELVEQTGRTRSINRRKWQLDALTFQLDDKNSLAARTLSGMRELVRRRNEQAAFTPCSAQIVLPFEGPLFAMERIAPSQKLTVLANVSSQTIHTASDLFNLQPGEYIDRNSDAHITVGPHITVEPHRVLWLERVKG